MKTSKAPMKKSLFTLSACILFAGFLSAQCMMREIPLNQRAVSSDLIIEGKVMEKKSFWDAKHQTIYTANTIDVYKIFKGNITTTQIEILTEGGMLGSDKICVEPSLQLNTGDMGVFTCENVKRFDNIPGNNTVPRYEAYGSAQGFVKYNVEEQTATDVFKKYTNIQNEVFSAVLAPEVKAYKEIQHIDLFTKNNKTVVTQAAPSITSFSPATVTAGTKTLLTINGSGFGGSQGSGTVGFKNADNAGANYINPVSGDYVSWSNTQITVYVPSSSTTGSSAGTGLIQVAQGATATSTGTLTISYAETNVNTGTTTYQTDHINDDGAGGYTWQMYTGFDANTSAKESFLRAFETWRCGSYINWKIGTTTSINTIANDGTNVIRFDIGSELPAGVLGRCTSSLSSCATGVWYAGELDIVFDDAATWEYGPAPPSITQSDFESVALHELGHGHQLAHVINTADVMHFALTTGQQRRVLTMDNLNCANDLMSRNIITNSCGPGAMVALNSTNCPIAAPIAQFSADPTNGCTPLVVNFMDQSAGVASSWVWDIDNDGSTDYTTKNPTHTYTASGTYAVKLTVGNVIGNTSLVKTAYISVGSASLPFTEDFETTTFPPAGWSVTQNPSDDTTWVRNTSAAGNGSSTACAAIDFFNYATAGGEKDYLITKSVDLTAVTGASMTFKVAYKNFANPANYDSLKVYISSDCGANFSPAVYTKGGPTLSTAGSASSEFTPSLASHWRTETVNLNTYAGNNIVVKFEGINGFGNNFYLDDVNIIGGNAPVAGFTGTPATLCSGQTASFTDQSTNSPTSWSWTFAGGMPPSSTVQNPSVVYNTAGTYSVSLTATNTFGSTTASQTNYITVASSPTVTISPASATICVGSSVSLNAIGASSYAWNTGETSAEITPSPTGTTSYTVTGTTAGCSDTKTVMVTANPLPSAPAITQNGNTLISSSDVNNQWYFNGSLMPGKTDDTLIALQNGNYYVVVTDVNGCTAVSATAAVTTTATSHDLLVDGNLSVFPNPTDGVFEITLDHLNGDSFTIEISNYLGQKIYSENVKNISGTYHKKFNLNKFQSGVYFVNMKTEAGMLVKKIVKE